jgi:hypothetical protein
VIWPKRLTTPLSFMAGLMVSPLVMFTLFYPVTWPYASLIATLVRMAQPLSAPEEIDYKALKGTLEKCTNDQELFEAIVNVPFTKLKVQSAFLFLGIIVLLLVDKKDGVINRIALSNTELAEASKEVSVKRFEDIKIPLNYEKNLIAKVIKTGKPYMTSDWKYLFAPDLKPAEARLNQANAGIALSAVYPLKARDGGAMIFSYFQYPEQIGEAQRAFMEKYSQLVTSLL